MALDREQLERWVFGSGHMPRHTQDSPLLPDVWYAYALPPERVRAEPADRALVLIDATQADGGGPDAQPAPVLIPEGRVDLLVRPHEQSSAPRLASAMFARLPDPEAAHLAYNDLYVAARLTFDELLRDVLPLSRWWQNYLWKGKPQPIARVIKAHRKQIAASFLDQRDTPQGRRAVHDDDLPGDLIWFVGLVGRIAWERSPAAAERALPSAYEVVSAALDVLGKATLGPQEEGTPLWAVNENRPVHSSVWLSRKAVKVDAAIELFGISCKDIRWAVIDSGIDARHPAFARRTEDKPLKQPRSLGKALANSRVVATYDFSGIRAKLTMGPLARQPAGGSAAAGASIDDPAARTAATTESWLQHGRSVDWDTIVAKLQVPHDSKYTPPSNEHGTHVAGILGADWRSGDQPSPGTLEVKGMCPDITLYDLRVFGADGSSDEFSILSAMQFVRHLNANDEYPIIHGVNLSFSVRHEVTRYAAGRTPVCDEANRLVGAGVVVVAAAGNEGRGGYMSQSRVVEGYRTVAISDPGNAAEVITVGATHRSDARKYGVSYFSSRGPTGDGRAKPDLVAPGEKVTSAVPNAGLKSMDGTSQATPHVSGAAALLLARNSELIGQPQQVKQILCSSCTDLGREPSFQGAGMLDVLRALQEI